VESSPLLGSDTCGRWHGESEIRFTLYGEKQLLIACRLGRNPIEVASHPFVAEHLIESAILHVAYVSEKQGGVELAEVLAPEPLLLQA